MSKTKLIRVKTSVVVVLVLVVICQRVGAIKSNYSIGFEIAHHQHDGHNNSHSGHGSRHGGPKNVFTTTPAPRTRPTYPTNIHMKPNRTLSTSSDFGHSNRNYSMHKSTAIHRSTTRRPTRVTPTKTRAKPKTTPLTTLRPTRVTPTKTRATPKTTPLTTLPPIVPPRPSTSSDFGNSNRNHSMHNTTAIHRSTTLRPTRVTPTKTRATPKTTPLTTLPPIVPPRPSTSSDFGNSNRNYSMHNTTAIHRSTTLPPTRVTPTKTRATPKTTPLTTLPPILPPRPPKPTTPPTLPSGNGTQPKVIYVNQYTLKNNSDLDDFNSFVTFLRNISSNANKHKKRPEVINGQKIHYYYVTRDYYHNWHSVPKVMEVKRELLKPCAVNATKVWCVPNTYSMCSTTGPTMCIAYMCDTVPCGNNTCVVTKFPCDRSGRNPACTHHNEWFAYIPCVSHIKLLPTPTNDFFTHMNATVIDLCAVSIIEAMPLESPVASIANLFLKLGKSHISTIKNYNITHK